ncbi:MAG: LysR family transcriptional regulator, partial [Hyphomicrobiales bacterium]|nr:LysR family transcriptional regulator [Hyphomicrobiales bacterium]
MVLPSLKQLRYLVALAEHEHFSRAAEACNVTQSTLSAGIKELEALLGAALAERTKRSVRLTPLGRDIAERSIVLLREAEDIVELAAAGRAPLTDDLHLGEILTIVAVGLPKTVAESRRRDLNRRLFLQK